VVSLTRRRDPLSARIARLRAHYGRPPVPLVRDPYHLLLWEQVAYLAPDDIRRDAFELLRTSVGLDPENIVAVPAKELERIVRRGGSIAVRQRAERLQAVADRVLSVWNGSLRALRKLPYAAARRALAKFPAIGEPGAEKILLLSGMHPVLALDSNGLRVLIRLGYGAESDNYSRMYRSAQAAAQAELATTVAARREAHLLLRQHGQMLCRRTRPRCGECPLAPDCAFAGRQGSSSWSAAPRSASRMTRASSTQDAGTST
jgi:endonuclease III